MTLTRVFLIILFLSLFIGIASATEDEELDDSISTLSDTKDALDIALEGNGMIQRQLEDPANETLVAENLENLMVKTVEPITGGLDDFDPDEFGDRMLNLVILAFAFKIFFLIFYMI